jgi:hypothetical protein
VSLKRDGTNVDGYFEATVKAGEPLRDIRIQAGYNETAAGDRVPTSHAPMYDENWPVVDPTVY